MITVLGAGGFIGSHIIQLLQRNTIDHYSPSRNEVLEGKELGDIIYCIGLTADFRSKPFETVNAHVGKLAQVLENCRFNSLTYLSSARLYINCPEKMVDENAMIHVDPNDPEELYTLTKLTGERLCLSSGRNCKVVRLSNVIGAYQDRGVFLSQVISTIKEKGNIMLEQALSSAKDYIGINEVAPLLVKMSREGQAGIYNIASGINTTHQELLEELKRYFKFSYSVKEDAPKVVFPLISNKKICETFGFKPRAFSEQLPLILEK